MIYGRAIDPQIASIAGASIKVTNTDTNVTVSLRTNETGYYEAALLLPGNYRVTAEAPGFRTSIRQGIALSVGNRVEIDLKLEIGGVADSVTVVAQAPLLDAMAASSGRVIDNRTQTGLPVSASNITVFARLAPGVQTNGEVRWLGPDESRVVVGLQSGRRRGRQRVVVGWRAEHRDATGGGPEPCRTATRYPR